LFTLLLGLLRPDRRRRTRPDDGADACATRPPRLVPADCTQHRPVPRLSVFELIIIATGASALSEQLFGFGGVPFWKILFGAIATGLAFLGPVGFVRKYVRKFAIWVVVASLVYSPGGRCTGSIRSGCGIAAARTRSGRASTSCSRRSSAGPRSSPTTPASPARAPQASGARGSGTSSQRSPCSHSAR